MTSIEGTSPKRSASSQLEALRILERKAVEKENAADADTAAKGRDWDYGRDRGRRKGGEEASPKGVVNETRRRKVEKEVLESVEEERWSPPGDVYEEFRVPEKAKPIRREKTSNRIRDIQRPKLPPIIVGHVVDPISPHRMDSPDRTPVTRTVTVSSLKSLTSRIGEKLNITHHPPDIPPKEEPPPTVEGTFKQRYECIRKIGEGAQGKVYVCKDRDDRKTYAVKVMITATEERRRNRQNMEKEIMRTFRDDENRPASVIEYIETFEEDEDPFTGEEKPRICHVMEHCKGPALYSILKNIRYMNHELIRSLCVDIAAGLKFIHSKDIIHCDLKPENIMFISEDRGKDSHGSYIRIIDFGLSIRLTSEWINKDVGGTLLYHPPELFKREKRVSKKMDMWAFGVILWEMIHGLNSFPISPITYQRAKKRAEVLGLEGNERIIKYWKEYNAKQFQKKIRFNSDRWKEMPDARRFCEQLLREDPVKRLSSDDESMPQYLEHEWNLAPSVSAKL